MAKQSKKQYELTWKPHGKRKGKKVRGGRWVKVIEGKQITFGSAPSKSDRKGYREALTNYKTIMLEHEEDGKLMKLAIQMRKQWGEKDVEKKVREFDRKSALLSLVTSAMNGGEDEGDDVDVLNPGGRSFEEVLSLIAKSKRHRQTLERLPKVGPGELTIADTVDEYLKARHRDVELTKNNPNVLARKKQLSESGYKGIEQHLQTFTAHCGTRPFGQPRDVEALLEGYRDWLIDKLSSGDYKAWTVNTKLSKLRTFIKWCVTKHHLEHEPANLADICASFNTEKAGKPLTLDVIHKIWKEASDRLRAWMAVSLNCGFYPVDVSRLHADHLQDGRIIQFRQKTHAQRNYKLWPITLELIDKTRQDRDQVTDGLLWVTQDGNPLVQSAPPRSTPGVLLSKLTRKIDVKATWSQFRDTSAQAVEAISRKQGRIDPALVSLFLSHRDERTAAYYLSSDPRDMETSTLDRAIDELKQFYGLADL